MSFASPTGSISLSTDFVPDENDSQGNGYRKMDTINFSTGIEKDNLSIRLYGQNVNDDEYLTSAFVAVTDFTSTTYFGYPNNYATYGLTVNYTF